MTNIDQLADQDVKNEYAVSHHGVKLCGEHCSASTIWNDMYQQTLYQIKQMILTKIDSDLKPEMMDIGYADDNKLRELHHQKLAPSESSWLDNLCRKIWQQFVSYVNHRNKYYSRYRKHLVKLSFDASHKCIWMSAKTVNFYHQLYQRWLLKHPKMTFRDWIKLSVDSVNQTFGVDMKYLWNLYLRYGTRDEYQFINWQAFAYQNKDGKDPDANHDFLRYLITIHVHPLLVDVLDVYLNYRGLFDQQAWTDQALALRCQHIETLMFSTAPNCLYLPFHQILNDLYDVLTHYQNHQLQRYEGQCRSYLVQHLTMLTRDPIQCAVNNTQLVQLAPIYDTQQQQEAYQQVLTQLTQLSSSNLDYNSDTIRHLRQIECRLRYARQDYYQISYQLYQLLTDLNKRVSSGVQARLQDQIEMIKNQSGMTFTDDQLSVLQNFSKQTVNILTGDGGCGKSTIASLLIKAYQKAFDENHVIGCAFTRRACSNLEQMVVDQHSHLDVYTIAKLKWMSANHKAFWKVMPQVVVIDEYSMINDADVLEALQYIKQYLSKYHIRRMYLLILGDVHQLPPITGASFALDVDKLVSRLNIAKYDKDVRYHYDHNRLPRHMLREFHLVEQHRHDAKSNLHNFCNCIRDLPIKVRQTSHQQLRKQITRLDKKYRSLIQWEHLTDDEIRILYASQLIDPAKAQMLQRSIVRRLQYLTRQHDSTLRYYQANLFLDNVEIKQHKLQQLLIQDYLQHMCADQSARFLHQIVSPYNRDVDYFNAHIVAQLHDQNYAHAIKLSENLNKLSPVILDKYYATVGDRIVFDNNVLADLSDQVHSLRINNGDQAVIRAIQPMIDVDEQQRLLPYDQVKLSISFLDHNLQMENKVYLIVNWRSTNMHTDQRLPIPFKLGYALTSHKAQGLTIPYVYTYLPHIYQHNFINCNLLYTVFSRAASSLTIYARNDSWINAAMFNVSSLSLMKYFRDAEKLSIDCHEAAEDVDVSMTLKQLGLA